MSYDKEGDFYTCKAGRPLLFTGYRTHKRKGGFSSQSKIYTCETCTGCTHLGTCYKGKYSKQIQVNENFDKYRKRSLANVTSQYGTVLRVNRSIQAEGVFGVLKENMQFTRFLTRGETNVRTEMLLLALGFNINKLHNRIQNGRLGQHLFPLQKAG
jgi:transposase